MDDVQRRTRQRAGRDETEGTTELKRRVYAVYLVLVSVAASLLLVFPPGGRDSGAGAIVLVVVPFALVFALLCLVALWRPSAAMLAVVERAGYGAAYPLVLGWLVLTLVTADDVVGRQLAVSGLASSLPLVIVWSFLAFGARGGAIGGSLFLGVAGLVVGTLHTLGFTLGQQGPTLVAQFAVTGSALIGGLFVFSRLLERQTQARASAEALAEFAWRDPLTGLSNRLAFERRFELARALARRGGGSLAICFVDLDDFKGVNDTLGHAAGDVLLRQFALRLQGTVRESDTVARIGGDEFVVLAFVQDAAQANVLADKLAAIDDVRFERDGGEVILTCSVGVSLYPHEAEDGGDLLDRADRAMYEVKRAHRARADAARPNERGTSS